MDIRQPDRTSYPALIPAEGALPAAPAQRSFHAPSPEASGEIIDCVEIHSENPPPALRRPASYPGRADRPPQTKGRWIDLWI